MRHFRFANYRSISGVDYSTRHGLPSNTILKILQDHKGFIWIFTQLGIASYNGKYWNVYDDFPKTSSNQVTAALLDRNGHFWIGTIDGLVFFRDGRFSIVELGVSGPYRHISDIVEDRWGAIWLICNNSGPFRIQNGIVEDMSGQTAFSPGFLIDLDTDALGNVYVASTNGLYGYSASGFEEIPIPGKMDSIFGKYIVESPSDIWFAGDDGWLIHVVDRKLIRTRFEPEGQAIEVYTAVRNPSGGIWIGTSKGLFAVDSNRIEHFHANNGLTSNLIYDVFFDLERNLWYGSDNGVGKVHGLQFRQIKYSERLPISTVNDILIDSANRKWIASTEGLMRIDGDRITLWNHQDGLDGDFVLSMLELSDRSVIASDSSGLFQVKDDSVLRISRNDNTVGYQLALSPDDTVWIASGDGFYTLKDGRFEKKNAEMGLPDIIRASTVVFDRSGTLWLGTDGDGAYFYRQSESPAVPIGNLPDSHVFSIFQDDRDLMWIATLQGVCLLKNNRINNIYTTQQGLSSNHVWTVFEDRNRNMWFATSKGLSCLKKGRITNYNVDDGISGDDFIADCVTTDEDGMLWFGGAGITIVNPDYTSPIVNPRVYIESAFVDQRPLYPGEKVSHNSRNFEFNSVCISFANEERNQYRYQLTGFDLSRSQPTDSPYTRYTYLPTGRYYLEVEAMNRDGVWSQKPAVFAFEVLPAWWEIRWIQITGSLSFVLMIMGIIQLRNSRSRAAARRLKEEVDRKTQVIQEQLTKMAEQKDQLEQLSITDELTGIFNRRYFFRMLDTEWERAERYGRPLSLILFDIDHFKKINDTYGHAAGDEVLRRIAGKMNEILRDSDTLARFGGEEFTILLPETDQRTAVEVAMRIRHEIQNLRIQIASHVKIGTEISGGISTRMAGQGMENPDELVRQADLALYRAKAAGRNRIIAFSDLNNP
ncbi:diguanylate cyclase [bacterium]|nr:diguanylate cyclase [candidate division CSSED10-310 bacterium]